MSRVGVPVNKSPNAARKQRSNTGEVLSDFTSQPPLPSRLDELDRQLIRLLTANGRTSNRALARLTKVSQVTVANRVRRLINEGIIRIVAVPDPERLGYPIEVLVSIQVEVKRIREVAMALCRLPEVRYVSITSGAYDLLIAALVRSNNELLSFLADKLAAIRGIQKLETAHALQVLKRNPDWSPFHAGRSDSAGPAVND
jgi:Lrp/AsnC family transcriptional regulator for asnA, asnC and gidA